jgi:hypothetical protein
MTKNNNNTDVNNNNNNKKKKPTTPPNKLVLFISKRKASKDKVELPNSPWNDPFWKKFYNTQIFRATSLLKLYPETAIYSVLNKHTNIYSLHAKWLPSLIEEEVINMNKIIQNNKKDEVQCEVNKTVRSPLPKKNLQNKLV